MTIVLGAFGGLASIATFLGFAMKCRKSYQEKKKSDNVELTSMETQHDDDVALIPVANLHQSSPSRLPWRKHCTKCGHKHDGPVEFCPICGSGCGDDTGIAGTDIDTDGSAPPASPPTIGYVDPAIYSDVGELTAYVQQFVPVLRRCDLKMSTELLGKGEFGAVLGVVLSFFCPYRV